MPAARKKSHTPECALSELPAIRGLILARIACSGGATRAQIVRDLGPMVSHKLSPAEWREMVATQSSKLVALGLCGESRGKFRANDTGNDMAEVFLRSKNAKSPTPWPELRDGRIVARALGLDRVGPATLQALNRPDGLRALILQKAFGIKIKSGCTPSQIRSALALIALERAFGNKIKTGLGSGSGFSAKAGRLLAAQLSVKPRDFGTDNRLVTCLAAEAVDARQTDVEALRAALLRGFVTRGLSEIKACAPAKVKSKPAKPANDTGIPGAAPHAIRRPGPEEFAALVKDAAKTCADGWSGNRKALICKVWNEIEKRHPGWALSFIEFKCMLAEAHRAGLLMLASADLKNKKSIVDIEKSAITYKNTVWHLVRVIEDEA